MLSKNYVQQEKVAEKAAFEGFCFFVYVFPFMLVPRANLNKKQVVYFQATSNMCIYQQQKQSNAKKITV